MISGDLYLQATKAIEDAHSADSSTEITDGKSYPSELLYSRRMLTLLEKVLPGNSYTLKLAAQCQHLKRWGVPRSGYPFDRTGYLQWRRVVMDYQLQQTNAILSEAGIDETDISEITGILRNQGNKSHEYAQIIEDTACLVFLKWYLEPFLAKHESEKVMDILKKSMRKMSDKGISLVSALDLPLPVKALLQQVA